MNNNVIELVLTNEEDKADAYHVVVMYEQESISFDDSLPIVNRILERNGYDTNKYWALVFDDASGIKIIEKQD